MIIIIVKKSRNQLSLISHIYLVKQIFHMCHPQNKTQYMGRSLAINQVIIIHLSQRRIKAASGHYEVKIKVCVTVLWNLCIIKIKVVITLKNKWAMREEINRFSTWKMCLMGKNCYHLLHHKVYTVRIWNLKK